ncbi:MAG: hypothetical protein Tsb0014_42550 [Pleurocapsa sp.]
MKVKLKICFKRFYFLVVTVSSILFIAVNIVLHSAIARYQQPIPQAILTLGGGIDREEFTAQLALSHPSLPIWVSTGSPPQMAREVFKKAGILDREFYLDRRATDTVTNFTTLVADFKKRNFQHIYLITSDFHMPRAKAIAFVVLGSQGITFTPVSVPSEYSSEPTIKTIRDIGRSLMWILIGRTGSTFNDSFDLPLLPQMIVLRLN